MPDAQTSGGSNDHPDTSSALGTVNAKWRQIVSLRKLFGLMTNLTRDTQARFAAARNAFDQQARFASLPAEVTAKDVL